MNKDQAAPQPAARQDHQTPANAWAHVTQREEEESERRLWPLNSDQKMSLLWAGPYLVFLAFPIWGIFEYGAGRPLGITMLAITAIFAMLYLLTWVLNPTAPSSQALTKTLVASIGALFAGYVAMVLVGVAIGFSGMEFMASFLVSPWVLQAPRRLIVAGSGFILALTALSVILVPSGMPFALAIVPMTGLACYLARMAADRDRFQEVEHARALALSEELERVRISADLHDILGHTLTGIAVKAELAGKLFDAERPAEAREQIAQVTELSRAALADVRSVVKDTRRLSPDGELLAARSFFAAKGIDLSVSQHGQPAAGVPSTLIAHTIREATTNILTHSRAKHVWIDVNVNGVRVRNDGYSARTSATTAGAGSGLTGLRDRVGAAGSIRWGADEDKWEVVLDLAP